MNSDFRELLQALHECKVQYLVAGGYAVIHHSQPRYTKDIDIWLKPSQENAGKLMEAFFKFGLGLFEDITEEDFARPGTQFSIGVAPCEIDFLTTIPGIDFESAWDNKVVSVEQDFPIYYLSKMDLIAAKETAGRPQDLADLDELRKVD